jgi:hypothetical protein
LTGSIAVAPRLQQFGVGLLRIDHAPIGLRPGRARRAAGHQTELESADAKADVEGLIELLRHPEPLPVPSLGALQVWRGIGRGT